MQWVNGPVKPKGDGSERGRNERGKETAEMRDMSSKPWTGLSSFRDIFLFFNNVLYEETCQI